jgi:hypothetical protein
VEEGAVVEALQAPRPMHPTRRELREAAQAWARQWAESLHSQREDQAWFHLPAAIVLTGLHFT